jgi:hypothetical protein
MKRGAANCHVHSTLLKCYSQNQHHEYLTVFQPIYVSIFNYLAFCHVYAWYNFQSQNNNGNGNISLPYNSLNTALNVYWFMYISTWPPLSYKLNMPCYTRADVCVLLYIIQSHLEFEVFLTDSYSGLWVDRMLSGK